ncbi:pilus assembly protein TadG-related protein [Frigidibacter sp. ROC022]|uniref:pilus assembly protein TadG-related protein n=1 Tax=Frigidibacter sp. ROC022 TaxID=2971796 RepID=UPI00215ADCED|nr:pilus assembly protein TadG-related protein [Frigidibacter sp. ROC022]MCR8723677.1 pilus assembly protein TadG-related protein [Frigidibacter sp. ROC022]
MFSLKEKLLGGAGLGRVGARRRFARDEAGSFTILNLFLLMTVMMVAGIAVDAIRFEAKRARLQNTLDRAILAAADMGQTLTPAQVVQSYFDKAGLSEYYAEPQSSSGFNSKTVSATATGTLDTFFMSMFGIDTLSPVASGTAEESISDIEISLVLDVSGSMGEPIYEYVTYYSRRYGSRTYRQNTGTTKLESLQNAAKEFVDTIYASTVDARTSMSIIPYNMQVNAGPDLLAHYTLTNQNTTNYCVDFSTEDFSNTAVSTTSTLYRSDVFDYYYRTMPPSMNGICPDTTYSRILVLADDPEVLKDKIDALQSGGNTSIEIGMKWGTALLDPSAQPAVSGMIADGKVSSSFEGRPFSYTNSDTMKVIVVMTDGINTTEYKLNDAYKGQKSGVWRWWDGSDWKYSVYYPESSSWGDSDGLLEYYWRKDGSGSNRWGLLPEGAPDATELTYYDLWKIMSVDYHAYYLRYKIRNHSSDYYAWDDEPITYVGGSTKDARLSAMCNAAKEEGIIVFSIGFEVTDDSADILEACASSPSHFYRVNGLEITTAFQSIANAIGKLRLTQ